MAQVVKLKRTSVQGKIPTTSNLELGELAINTYDGRIFFEKDNGASSIQEILTTNSSNSGSFNLIGAISASSFVSASSFIGDGSQLTLYGTDIVSSSAQIIPLLPIGTVSGSAQIANGSNIISGSTQITSLGFAITGSNTFVGAQTIQNSSAGANYSLKVQGSTTGDRFGVITNTTAGNGIVINSRNAANNSDTKLSFSGSSFEFGGGDVNILGNLTLGGNITIGDTTTDSVVISAELSSSLIPDIDNTFDLGSSSKKWRHIYATSASIDDITLNSSGIVSSSAQVTSLLPTGTVSGSSQVLGGSGIHSSSNQVISSLSNQTVNFGTGDITANSFSGDGSSLTGITVSQAATVADTFTNQTSVTVTHNFNTRNILVAVYDNTNNQIIPQNVNTSNLNQAVITFPSAVTGTVVVAKGGHIVTAAATSFGGNFVSNTSLNGYTISGSGNINFVGDLTVNGNATVTGTLTLSNADDIRIQDNILLLNWGKGNTDGGLEVSAQSGGTGSLFWDESAGHWKGGVKGSEYQLYTTNNFNISSINSFTQSIDTRVTNTESTGSVHESRLDTLETATGSYQSLGAGVLSGSAQITAFGFISGSDLNEIHSYTSSLKQAIEVSGTNLTVLGDLTVQGTNTSLNTTQLLIEDKLITLASGSTTSLQADGAGIEIAGANKTLIWDHTNSSFLFDAKVSSSVGFKGNGSELTDIAYSNIIFGGTGVVSGSDQVTSSLDLRYLEINGDGVVSGSDQVTSSLDLRYLEINGDGVVSGSDQVTSSLDLRYLEINGDNVLSSSNENFTDYSQSVDTRLIAVEAFSSSLDINNAILTGSFTGSFTGDGSGLTGISVAQVATLTASFSDQSTINVAHNFDTYNVIVSTYDTSYNQLIPQSVSLTDKNTVQVVLSAADSGHVVVAKGGHIIAATNSFRQSVSGNTSYTVTHNLDESYPFVQAWNTGSNQMEIPSSVTSNSANQITVAFNNTFNGKIIVKR